MSERVLPKERGSKLEQKLIEVMVEQYYHYISLMRMTNNFQKKLELYEGLDFAVFEGNIAIVGYIGEIVTEKEQPYKNYVFPVVQTPINRYLFVQGNPPYAKKPFACIRRKLVVRLENYAKALVVPLNRMVTLGRKDKSQLFMFTHLSMQLQGNGDLCYSLTQHSYIVQLQGDFYRSVLRPLQASLESNYGEINLQRVFVNQGLQREETCMLGDIRAKVGEGMGEVALLGVLRRIFHDSYKQQVNAKEKEMLLEIGQDVFPKMYVSVGVCRLFLRFDIMDEQEVLKFLQEGTVYVFVAGEVTISDNFQLLFKVVKWRTNIKRIVDSPIENVGWEERLKQLKPGALAALTYPYIFRNYYKFRVMKSDVRFIHLKLECERCEGGVMRVGEQDYRCKGECGRVEGRLRVWALVGVMDKSGFGQLNLQDQVALTFFNIEGEAGRMKEEVGKQQMELRKGVSLYFRRQTKLTGEEQYDDAIVYDKNPYLTGVLFGSILVPSVEKEVVGVPRVSSNDSFTSFEEDARQELQNSFGRPKEHLKKAKLFANGQFKLFEERWRCVPQIKVERVYPIVRGSN